MAVGLAEIHLHIGLLLAAAVVKTVIPFLRFYILRHTRRTTVGLCGDVFFGFSWILACGVVWYDVKIAFDELAVRSRLDSEFAVLLEIVRSPLLKYLMSERLAAITILWSVKAAFLCFYWNLVSEIDDTNLFKYSAIGTGVVLFSTFAAINIIFLTYCLPLSRQWDIDGIFTQTICSPSWALMPQTVWMVLTVFTDLLILCFPLMFLRYVTLSQLERRMLPFLFIIGCLSIVPPIVRYSVAKANGQYAVTGKASGSNITLHTYHLTLQLNELEDLGAFVSFCLPSFRMLLVRCSACGCSARRIKSKISALHTFTGSSMSAKSRRSGGQDAAAARRRELPLVSSVGFETAYSLEEGGMELDSMSRPDQRSLDSIRDRPPRSP